MTDLKQIQADFNSAMWFFFFAGVAITIITLYLVSLCSRKSCQHNHTTRRVIWGRAPHAVEAEFCLDCSKQISETNE